MNGERRISVKLCELNFTRSLAFLDNWEGHLAKINRGNRGRVTLFALGIDSSS